MKRATLALLALVLVLAGCGDNELGIDKRKKNLPPETVLASGPPDSTTGAVYKVHLFWSGSDPDGTIDHFDFIMVDHPAAKDNIDGGDPSSRVVVEVPEVDDPRWIGTSATDSIFITISDTLRRDPQPGPGETPEDVRRALFERWHTFFVRAVDNEGNPDPTPDYRSFNAVNIAPTVALKSPIKAGQIFQGPPVIIFNWEGQDPVGDGTFLDPVASRWVMITSQVQLSNYLSFPDSLYNLPARFSWTPWNKWDALDQSGVRAVVRNLVREGEGGPGSGRYIFAVQAMDEAGAITPVFDFSTNGKNNVALVRVTGAVGPLLTVEDEFLGTHNFIGGARPVRLDIAAGQPLRFKWRADASSYGGEIEAYRYGWDIRNPDNDEQWDVSWSIANRSAPTRSFSTGSHRFFLQARDNAETITQAIFELTVWQVTRQRDLLWVDDTQEIIPGSGQERTEDDRWFSVLEQVATENNFLFDTVRDVFDVSDNRFENPPINKVFDYKTVIWSVRSGSQGSALNGLAQFFDPFAERNRNAAKAFNFLNIYLKNNGKLWINGFRPALQLWPRERAQGQKNEPVNVTNWDDPIEPHPFIDSVGTTSLLYAMGVEMFDLGAGLDSKRFALNHFCRGFERGRPQGSDVQTFVSDEVESHTHLLDIPTADVDVPPVGGKTYDTDTQLDHKHTVTLTEQDYLDLQRGNTVVVTTSESPDPQPHAHVFELVDQVGIWGAPALVTGATWGQPSGQPGRPNIEIYNMPGAMASQRPPLVPLDGISVNLYTYVSGVPQDPNSGTFYPLTADKQPAFILAKGSPLEPFFGRAFCGFDPSLLDFVSHKRLVEYVIVRHFRLGIGDAN